MICPFGIVLKLAIAVCVDMYLVYVSRLKFMAVLFHFNLFSLNLKWKLSGYAWMAFARLRTLLL